ncbi:MAG TPA: AAA family ATPase, partial [Polyangiales bacterium]|nr:AAA family ATPase [Polyangiales bacterium]
DLAQAYLQTPTLVGRDEELARFRAAVSRVKQGAGSGLWLEAPSGGGRSRLLDAWVLEAKTQGIGVVRAGGQASDGAFATIYDLSERLLEVLPEQGVFCARDVGVFERLFEASARPRLHSLPRLLEERDKLPQALSRWIERICREHALCFVLDDAERADDPSLAILAALAHAAPKLRALVVLGVTVPLASDAPAALALLAKSCKHLSLQPLSLQQTEALFASVFGSVPNVALISDRIHTISVGNPRVALSVAQHMLDSGLVRYAEGSWLLPAELTLNELPADAEHLLYARLASLSPLARRLAELQALAMAGQFTRADYAELAVRDSASQVDVALDALVRLGLVASDGVSYTLAHRGDRALLLGGLSPERCSEHHLALAGHFAARAALGIAEVHHLLLAGAADRALDRLAQVLQTVAARGEVVASAGGITLNDVAATLERAFECSRVADRPAREQQAIVRALVTLSIATDNKLYWRYAGYWFARLERDSGLADYRALDSSSPAPERLKRALDTALARYSATPELERVYRVDEAIRFLARYVTISIAIGARARNGPLLRSLGGLLEPFAPLTPLLYALWQNAVSAYEMNFLGSVERARERALHVYEKLGECQGAELSYAELVRKAVAAALAIIDTSLGMPSASHWLELIEQDALQAVNANYLRRLWCIVEGDRERAEHYRMRAEVLALQSNVRQMFMPPLRHELVVQIRAGDLAGVKQCVDQIARLAEQEAGWNAMHELASGYYEHLRGDLDAARAHFERSLELCGSDFDAPDSDPATRAAAAGGYVALLVARGETELACAFGRSELARCEASGMQAATWDLVRALALAEAKHGEHESAARRIDALLELREGVLPAHR